ncbi:MAG: hypothetical protein J5449_05800 [Oscillospiraceae bacterium]|nr:hypothetical protein [Oscillospiraceae bacterium]
MAGSLTAEGGEATGRSCGVMYENTDFAATTAVDIDGKGTLTAKGGKGHNSYGVYGSTGGESNVFGVKF